MFEGPFGKGNLLQVKELSKINPSRFYVENVRAMYDISKKKAQNVCEQAVRNGFVRKKIGLECPNEGRIIESFQAPTDIPETIVCDLCAAEGAESFEFLSASCKRVEFYELITEENNG